MVGAEYCECREKKNARRGFITWNHVFVMAHSCSRHVVTHPLLLALREGTMATSLPMRHTAISTWFGLSTASVVCVLAGGARLFALSLLGFIRLQSLTFLAHLFLVSIHFSASVSPLGSLVLVAHHLRHHATTRRCLQCGLGSLIYFQCSCGR